MELIFGAGKLDRRVDNVEDLLREYRDKERDWGLLYLDYEPVTPSDRLVVEDIAVTMLINSRVTAQAATSVYTNGATLDLGSLPRNPRTHPFGLSFTPSSQHAHGSTSST